MVINGVASSQNIADATGVALGADVAIKAENDKQMSIQMPGHASGAQHGSGQPK
ncbi:MAG: hypothetical protein KAG14_01775 [Mycoplasmataceae bacterium]|nr:hypothetical protein [Mycoplasmataceae bacterium]